MLRFYEFFAGGGMARAGLGRAWECAFANELDAGKAASYAANWGSAALRVADIATLHAGDLPGRAALAWASFPCQDLSLAGNGAGLRGSRSGTFWSFWRLMQGLASERRAPPAIALENVCGALTSNGGNDFRAIAEAFAEAGYSTGALVIDAALFVPQSRPRLFVVAVRDAAAIPSDLLRDQPDPLWHPAPLIAAARRSPRWLWWNLPAPPRRTAALADILEGNAAWDPAERTDRLLGLMSPLHRGKVEQARTAAQPAVGAVYLRTRLREDGSRGPSAEVRFDGLAGCLRTPGGGSSRQSLLAIEGQRTRSRLLTAREAARLMGLPDSYKLPERYSAGYHLAGDGVVVPVVRHLAQFLLEPLLDSVWRPDCSSK